jgi:hypothetical protein
MLQLIQRNRSAGQSDYKGPRPTDEKPEQRCSVQAASTAAQQSQGLETDVTISNAARQCQLPQLSVRPSVRLSIRPHLTTRLLLGVISWNIALKLSIKICRKIQVWLKSGKTAGT